MKILADRDSYDDDPTGFMKRMPWAAGIFFGLWMGLFSFFVSSGESLIARWITSSVAGIVAGLLFGVGASWSFRFLIRRITDRIYRGDRGLIAAPPEGYSARLPCGRWIRPQRAVPGVLYLGPTGSLFLPHTRLRGEGQFALSAQDLASVTLTTRQVAQSWLERRLSLRPPEALVLTTPAGEFVLLVPRLVATLAAIKEELAVFAPGPGAGANAPTA